MVLGFINHVSTEDLGDVLAGLVRNGLTFSVSKFDDRSWVIELTGGH